MAHIKKYSFLIAFLVSVLPLIGYLLGGVFLYMPLVILFIVIPLLDHWFHDPVNPTAEQGKKLLNIGFYKAILLLYVPVQLSMLVFFLIEVSRHNFAPVEFITLCATVGIIMTGAIGITIAHELLHKRGFMEQQFSKVLLTCVCFGHYFVEHPRGHHVRVATPNDPVTGRFDESFYRYYLRAIPGSLFSAWRLEQKRMATLHLSVFNWRNHFWWIILGPIAAFSAIYHFLGQQAAIFYLGQAFFAFTALMAVDYVEHYGLQRKKLENGRYERTTPRHSWNANNWLTNIILFHLQRHSDHHARPEIPYQGLRHLDESPQLPSGYAGMLVIAFLPPLWFKIMNPRVSSYQQQTES